MKHRLRTATFLFAAGAALLSAVANGSSDRPPELKYRATDLRSPLVAAQQELVRGFIVKPHRRHGAKLAQALRSGDARALSKSARMTLRVHRRMSNESHVLRMERAVTLAQAKAIAEDLMRSGEVELAEPDRVLHASTTLPPTDPGYSFQWHYFAPSGANKGGANLPNAWSQTLGSASIKVAVLDTGYRPHADLATVLPGYDFVTNDANGNDGNSGRDGDALDPGDNCSTATVTTSSWHGTHVAGTIAALMSNSGPGGLHGTGIAPETRLLPVRVLGKCGGVTSDVVDAMRWAAGIAVPNAPANANPARVLNLSLGASGACSAALASAVQDVVNQGAAVVVAAGNDASIGLSQPANCPGAIAVTAHAIDGDNANYANISREVAISAPGGGCGSLTTSANCTSRLSANGLGVFSLSNTGSAGPVASPGGDSYAVGSGTSMAAPHVAGVIALMLAQNSSLTPAQIKSYLQSSARPHPAGSTCTQARYSGLCGEGLLDAEGALGKVDDLAPAVQLANSYQVVAPGANVQLSGTGIIAPGRTANYSWVQVASVSVGLSGTSVSGNTASASFSAPASGVYTFRLTAQDNTSKVGSATATVKVNSAPVLTPLSAQSVSAGGTLNFRVGAIDPDGDVVSITYGALPPGAYVSGGNFTWAGAAPAGAYTVNFTATDADGASSSGSVTVSVTGATGGGGGSLDGGTLLALAVLAALVRMRRLQHKRQEPA
jgi:serine protease